MDDRNGLPGKVADCPDSRQEDRILASWNRNAQAWTSAVREQAIASRRLVTDAAIVTAVQSLRPDSVLDAGCGEGWLARVLDRHGIAVTGVDATPELIASARSTGGAEYHCLSYEALVRDGLGRTFDAVVCNFSLLGGASVEAFIRGVPGLLSPGGALIVQTLHPHAFSGDEGWREGSWGGFGDRFTDPAPWYFRTLEGWHTLFRTSGLRLADMREPRHPDTGAPASVLFIATID